MAEKMIKIAGLDLSIASSGVIVETLDDNFDVLDLDYLGFTQKKKDASEKIHYYKNKDYRDNYEKYIDFSDKIIDFIKDCDYIAFEDYGYAAKGYVFNLAEFEGYVKIRSYLAGKKMRLYAINSIKKFFSLNGNSDKISMAEAFNKFEGVKPDISCLPEVTSGRGVSPTSDIVDGFAVCEFLRKELKIRHGIESLNDQHVKVLECFNSITKDCPNGLLVKEFIQKK